MQVIFTEANLVQDRTSKTEKGTFRKLKFAEIRNGETSEIALSVDPALRHDIPLLRPVSVVMDVSGYMSGYELRLRIEEILEVKPIK